VATTSSFAGTFAGQLAHPSGLAGQLLGRAMDVVNLRPTRMALDLLVPVNGENVLDVGCGTGAALHSLLRRSNVHAVGIDPSQAMAARAGARLDGRARIFRSSIETMDFPHETFDAALMLNVLYFCDPAGQLLSRVRDVLRPGGRIVAYVTHRDTMQNWAFAQAGVHNLFDETDLLAMFTGAGFDAGQVSVQTRAIARSVKGLFVVAHR